MKLYYTFVLAITSHACSHTLNDSLAYTEDLTNGIIKCNRHLLRNDVISMVDAMANISHFTEQWRSRGLLLSPSSKQC